jgi:hypothetical protein
MPISFVRATHRKRKHARDPDRGDQHRNAPNDETSAAFSRRGATLWSRICETVRTFSIGSDGATLRTTRVVAGTRPMASRSVRITSPPVNATFLRERQEHHRPDLLGIETAVFRVADDTDHRAPVAAHRNETQHVARPGHALVDRILVAEQPLGERFVQDDHAGGAVAIQRRELAALS